MNKILRVLAMLIACTASIGTSGKSVTSNGTAAVVMIDKNRSGFVETIDSKTPSKGLFRALIDLNKGGTTRVTLMVNEEVSLKKITDTEGLLSKAGFNSVRIFYFGKDKDWMQEISYSPVYVFSKNADKLTPMHQAAIKLRR